MNRRSRENGKELFTVPVGETGVEQEEEEKLEVVRVKRFDLKPMDSEEAILQMDMLGHSFFIYTDAETDGTHIVYKRKDGKYGLIEAQS